MSSSSSHPNIILTSSPDGPITAFDATTGVTLCHFSGSRSPCHGLTLVGNSFIAVSHISPETASSGSIHLYNWWSSTALHNFLVPEPVAPLAATPDGLYIFAGGVSGYIYTLSVPSGDIIRSYSAHNKPVSCLQISEDKSLLISGSDDGTIAFVPIFQIVDQELISPDGNSSSLMIQRFVAHGGTVTAIEQYGSTIISCSMDSTVKFWGMFEGITKLRKVSTFPCAVMGVALDQMKTEFFAAGSDGFIYNGSLNVGSEKYSNRGGECIRWAQRHEGGIVSLMTMSDGKNLVSASEDGKVFVWEIERGKIIMEFGTDMGCISDMVVVANYGIGQGLRLGKRDFDSWDGYGGFYKEEISRTLRETLDLEEVLKVAAKDRTRAIDMLESAISMYERLLELILKEAMKGLGSSKK